MPERSPRFTLVGIGEAVFDLFPSSQRLGGAPVNVAAYTHQLASQRGGRGVLVSRVGQDALGEDLLAELRERGLDTSYIQSDPDRPTGRVVVQFDRTGQPDYEILPGVAWDVIQYDPELEDLAATCTGVAFGTLAQRDGQSRNTIYRFLDACRRATKLFDVNLRDGFDEHRPLGRSLELADIAKLNRDELGRVLAMLGLGRPMAPAENSAEAEALAEAEAEAEAAQTLRLEFHLDQVVVTRGERGTAIYTDGGVVTGEVPTYEAVEGADAVGAGDAATAGLLVAGALRWPAEKAVELANHMGAYAASQPGGVATLPQEILAMVAAGG